MPYPSYARMTDADIHALYVYFRDGVAPQAQTPPPNRIPWPFSMRWPLRFWRMAFSPSPINAREATERAFPDTVLARGAYLVEGPGHCGACHTPRAATLQEKALTGSSDFFLAGGGQVDGWIPVSLRGENRTGLGRWSEDDIVAFLRDGRIQNAAAFGGMTDAIGHGTQHLSDGDLHAIARFLKTLSPATTPDPAWAYNAATTTALRQADRSARGARAYIDHCAACHRSDGHAYPTVFPPLAGNPVVMSEDPASLIRIVLAGSTLAATQTAPSAFTMPGFENLTDAEIADVVTFIRTGWGNNAPPVDAAAVKRVRSSLKG
jgi:mono/diheme cytochrome c family protein